MLRRCAPVPLFGDPCAVPGWIPRWRLETSLRQPSVSTDSAEGGQWTCAKGGIFDGTAEKIGDALAAIVGFVNKE